MNNLYDKIRIYLPISEIELKLNDESRPEQGNELIAAKDDRIDL